MPKVSMSGCVQAVFRLCSGLAFAYRIAEKFRGRKLSQIGEKYDFHGENVRGLLASAAPKDATRPNFAEKTFANRHKTAKFANVFSFESFSYTVASYPDPAT